MNQKSNEATILRPQGNRIIDSTLLTIDTLSFIKQIRKEKPWKESDRNAITVFKTNGMSIVLIALHKGAEMIKHTAEGLISVQVLKGKIMFNTDNESVELTKGQILVLHEGISHSVLAKKKTSRMRMGRCVSRTEWRVTSAAGSPRRPGFVSAARMASSNTDCRTGLVR